MELCHPLIVVWKVEVGVGVDFHKITQVIVVGLPIVMEVVFKIRSASSLTNKNKSYLYIFYLIGYIFSFPTSLSLTSFSLLRNLFHNFLLITMHTTRFTTMTLKPKFSPIIDYKFISLYNRES